MKVYKYSPIQYFASSIGPVILMIIILIYTIFIQIQTPIKGLNNTIIFIVSLLLLSELGALNQPQKITDDDQFLTFYGIGRKHIYKWSNIKSLKIKIFPLGNRLLIRIDNYGFSKGMYWIDKKMMNSIELINKLKEFEMKLIQIK